MRGVEREGGGHPVGGGRGGTPLIDKWFFIKSAEERIDLSLNTRTVNRN